MGKTTVVLNMDETYIPYYLSDRAGWLASDARHTDEFVHPPAQQFTRSQMRKGITYCCVIADRPWVQALMPQFLLCVGSGACVGPGTHSSGHEPG